MSVGLTHFVYRLSQTYTHVVKAKNIVREREKASWIAQKNPSTGELKKAQGIHVRAEGEGPNRHLTYKQAPWPVVVVTSVETLLFSTVKRTLSDIQSKQCGRTKHTPGQKQKGQAEKATKQVRATGKMLR